MYLLTACSSAPAPEPSFSAARGFDPLEVCVTTGFTRHVRSVACRETELLFVSRADDPGTLTQAKRGALSAYGIPVEDRFLRLGGRDVPVLGYFMGPFESAAVSALFIALPQVGSQESIDAQCFHRGGPVDPKRCSTLLDAFIERGITRGEWPSSLSARDPQTPIEFDLAGTKIRLPSNCDELAPLELECRDGHVKMLVAEAPEQLPRMLQTDLASREGAALRTWTAPCTVDGVNTTCTLREERWASGELVSLHANLVLRGTPLMLACAGKKSRSASPPGPICSQLFQLTAEAWMAPEPAEEL